MAEEKTLKKIMKELNFEFFKCSITKNKFFSGRKGNTDIISLENIQKIILEVEKKQLEEIIMYIDSNRVTTNKYSNSKTIDFIIVLLKSKLN
jgi:hypothetical protein